ncbi:TPA: hypothetical protein ACK1V4_000766 [Klebsiella aerogenes]|jgi:hypothetical protein|uniref:hypothetical protein n=1 Tax=Klebsiella aerogenes TaxID=548 RepID=UPI0005E04451|nr:hypothetical protein [Klebsiella aerogenes]EKU0352257.1 hypothetical protein [Klebsiella aerogenes]ELA2348997.1 hypothetical protein [Klebsiella aerogenes]ELA3176142.1 hypothetical protein [Klebsiella aerogenes]ELN9404385.1 hypothetical protein [Klebsiella aerogenes]ELX9630762.1 hypothetical protein [Klebsiella aerogenes]
MLLTAPELAAIIAVAGIAVQFWVAYLARRQIARQHDLQHLISHRTTASFVADKRQKWIDELRTDMAFHLALSQEIIWKWDSMRQRAHLRIKEDASNIDGTVDQVKAGKILQEITDKFSPENGARDREHQERHTRIMFRLNPKEELHIKPRQCLEYIRVGLSKTQGAKTRAEADEQLNETIRLIAKAQEHTQDILRAEWQRVKQEVAYPEALISTIPKPDSCK